MVCNILHRIVFILRKIVSDNSLNPKYISIFLYLHSILCVTFTYSYHATRLITEEFIVKIYRLNEYPKVFSFGICKVVHSIQS